MRIAYILADPGIGIFGTKGASVHAQEMIRAFRALGHEVTVFTTKRGNRSDSAGTEFMPPDLLDLPVFVVPVAGAKGAAARERATARASQRMASLAAEGSYDLVYERYSLFSSAGAQLKELVSTRREAQGDVAPLVVVEVNAPLLTEQSTHRKLHDAEAAMESTLRTLAAADLISCVSKPVADWVRCLSPPLHHGKAPEVVVTPNGVNLERFVRADSHGEPERPFTVGFLGTLKPWHGTEVLFEAFAQLIRSGAAEDAVLEILGDGPQRNELEALADRLCLNGRVVFHGTTAPAQVPEVLAGWDVGAAPYPEPQHSSGYYFSPLKIYEYMAAGLAVVASGIGEISEMIEHRRTGVLVPGSDPEALADALAGLADDLPARQRMGSAARAEAEAQHDWESRAAKVLMAVKQEPVPGLEVAR